VSHCSRKPVDPASELRLEIEWVDRAWATGRCIVREFGYRIDVQSRDEIGDWPRVQSHGGPVAGSTGVLKTEGRRAHARSCAIDQRTAGAREIGRALASRSMPMPCGNDRDTGCRASHRMPAHLRLRRRAQRVRTREAHGLDEAFRRPCARTHIPSTLVSWVVDRAASAGSPTRLVGCTLVPAQGDHAFGGSTPSFLYPCDAG